MNEWPDLYYIENLEQLRAVADTLRIRLIELLADQPSTVTQAAELLSLPANKVHYHVRELERVGLLRLVETRERGGILEKYYRTVARSIQVPESLLTDSPSDETLAVVTEMLRDISSGALDALSHKLAHAEQAGRMIVMLQTPYMTDDEFRQMSEQIDDLLKPFAQPRGLPDERQRRLTLIAHDAVPARAADQADSDAAAPAAREKRVRVVGVLIYSRKDLERYAAAGTPLDIAITGMVLLANDITPELAHQAIRRLSVRGKLIAPPAVRETLERKGALMN